MSQQFLQFQKQIKTEINQARKESVWLDKAVFLFFFVFRRVEVGRVESSRVGVGRRVSKAHSVEQDGIKKERTARCTAERVKLTPAME